MFFFFSRESRGDLFNQGGKYVFIARGDLFDSGEKYLVLRRDIFS